MLHGALLVLISLVTSVGGDEPHFAVGPLGMTSPSAQAPGEDPRLERADSIFLAGDAEGALALVLEVLEEDGEAYEPLWRASSYALATGVLEEAETGETGRYEEALEMAERALAVDPDGLSAHYWKVAALGRLALGAGPREAMDYAEKIREGSLFILERDPDHAGAHHALGKLYLEIMGVSGMSRFLGRTFAGGEALGEASWSRAESHLKKATSLAPEMLLFQLDLARLYRDRRRTAQAKALLERLAEAPIRQPPDRVFRDEVREILRDIS